LKPDITTLGKFLGGGIASAPNVPYLRLLTIREYDVGSRTYRGFLLAGP
jgi:acetylornithine/succinyldiaminopimelate/putrescine aminotransferase